MPFTVLGACGIRTDAGDRVALSEPQTIVVATLLASATRETDIDAVASVLAASGHHELDPEHVVVELGASVGAAQLVRGPRRTLRLVCGEDDLDAAVFERLLHQAQVHIAEPDRAIDLLRRAMECWTGPAFGGLRNLVRLRHEADRLERLRLDAEELLVDLLIERHDVASLDLAEQLLARDPLRESATRLRILALYRSGRRAEAFRVLREATEAFARNGRPPSRALADLELAMVLERPSLEARRTAPDLQIGSPDVASPDRPVVAVPGAVPLVGRHAERQWFEERLADAMDGNPFFAIIEGESGIGKSHLARHVAQIAGQRGWEVLFARGDERVDLPLWPLVSSVLPALRDATATDAAMSVHETLLSQLAALHPIDDSMRSVALRHDAFRSALTTLATRTPVLIVMDDMQWADRSTFDLLLTAARLVSDTAVGGGLRLAIIGTLSTPPATDAGPILEQIGREPRTSRVVLQGLDDLEIEELVRRFGIRQAPRDWVAGLARATGGNPLFAGAAIRNAIVDGRVDARDLDALPSEGRDAIASRIDELHVGARECAVAASVLGAPWNVELVAAILGRDPPGVAADVELLTRRGIATSEADGVRFAHPLLEAAILETVDPARRRRMHARAAELLLVARRSDPAATLVVFRHLAEGDDSVDVSVAVRVAIAAGQHAETLFAWGDAAKCYEHALRWSSSTGDEPGSDRGELLCRAGMARLHNGQPAVATHHLEAATEALARSDDLEKRAGAWVGRVQAQAVTVRPGEPIDVGDLEELATALEARSPAVAADVWANLVQPFWMSGRIELARAAAQRALGLAESVGDHRSSLWALWNRSMAEWTRLELVDAMTSLQNARGHASMLADRKQLTGPLMRLPLCHFWLGELGASVRAVEQARALSREVNYTLENGLFLNAQAQLALARGALDEAEDTCSSCLTIEDTTGYAWASALALPTLARARLLRDDVVGVRAVIARWVKPGARSVHEHAADCLLRLLDGSSGPSRVVDGSFARVGGDTAAGLSIELAFESGSAKACEGAIELIRELHDRKQQFTTTMALCIPRLMALASSLDRSDAAIEELRSVQRAVAASGLHLEVLQCEYALAVHLDRVGDRASARRSFTTAERSARTLGAHHIARKCQRMLRRLGGPLIDPADSVGIVAAETVSILFVDIAESTALTERLGDWAFRTRARQLDEVLRALVETHRGTLAVGVTLGDGILADFHSARDAADSALACAAAAEHEGLPVHVGLHAGDVLREAGTIFGGAVNIAARVCSLSDAGEVLASQTFCELARTSTSVPFRDRGLRNLKGISRPLRIYSLGRLDPTVRSGQPVGVA